MGWLKAVAFINMATIGNRRNIPSADVLVERGGSRNMEFIRVPKRCPSSRWAG